VNEGPRYGEPLAHAARKFADEASRTRSSPVRSSQNCAAFFGSSRPVELGENREILAADNSHITKSRDRARRFAAEPHRRGR